MTKVTKDLFGIADRILKINPRYRVFYNNCQTRFEVHTDQLEFVVPYDRLDSRTLDYARETRVQNADFIEKEIHEHNQRISRSCKDNLEKSAIDLKQRLAYAYRTGRPVAFTKNYVKEF